MSRSAVCSVLLLGLIVAFASASETIGNPWVTKADIKLQNGAVEEREEPDVAGTDMLTDEALVEGKFGDKPVNLENLKIFVKQRGVSDIGLISDLISRAACIVRLEADIGEELLSSDSIADYLRTRELAAEGSRDSMLDSACDYSKKETFVRKQLNKTVADINKEELSSELQRLGFISTSGTKPELVAKLGAALGDLSTIRELTGMPDVDTSSVKDLLTSRGLSSEGPTGAILDRLASYLVDVSSTAGIAGINGQCDFVMGNSICINGGGSVVAPAAVPRGLAGHWTFDDAVGLDSSGKANHLASPHTPGVGFDGKGSSASFGSENIVHIPHSQHFESQDFCVTMWLYLRGDSTGAWRSLVHKGNQDHERTPTFFLEPLVRGLEMFVSTTDTSQPAGERLWSNTFIPLQRWTHIAGCVEGRNMRLFINGVLDAENTTVGAPILNQGPLYLGGDPWRQGGSVDASIDELRYYTRALTVDEIQAQSQNALGGVEPAFVELGCMGCTLDTCVKSCRRGYRVATQRDLVGGAYMVARNMGWANSETRLWTAEDNRDASDTPNSAGLCTCVREEE